MGKANKKAKAPSATIAQNRKARHEYHLEEHFEAGLVLEGWEVKSLRAGKGNLTEAYVLLKNGEAFLFGARFEPLNTASTHVNPDPTRTRKLLLHRRELGRVFGGVQKDGFTCVPVSLYWKKGFAKCDIALAKASRNSTSAPLRKSATGIARSSAYCGRDDAVKRRHALPPGTVSGCLDYAVWRVFTSCARLSPRNCQYNCSQARSTAGRK